MAAETLDERRQRPSLGEASGSLPDLLYFRHNLPIGRGWAKKMNRIVEGIEEEM